LNAPSSSGEDDGGKAFNRDMFSIRGWLSNVGQNPYFLSVMARFIARSKTLVKEEHPPSRRPAHSSHDIIICPPQWGNANLTAGGS
jgi:hypothetical protein